MDPTTSEELPQGTLMAPMELQMAVKEENYRTARSLKGIVMKVSNITGWEAKRLKGCAFSPPSLLLVPGREKEARKRNLYIASNPVSVLFSLRGFHI